LERSDYWFRIRFFIGSTPQEGWIASKHLYLWEIPELSTAETASYALNILDIYNALLDGARSCIGLRSAAIFGCALGYAGVVALQSIVEFSYTTLSYVKIVRALVNVSPPPQFFVEETQDFPSDLIEEAQELGRWGIRVRQYCIAKGYTNLTFSEGNAYSWYCINRGGQIQVDFQTACREVYGASRPYAQLRDSSDHYGWRCSPMEGYVDPP
jgi:hypothetical protein